jgi:glycosyltransferase involved in cell wall biosynthesis
VIERTDPTVAVILPCYNEGAAIATVVADFQRALPGATVYVYDNNSTDDTADAARRAGAVVRQETMQGKGNVIRRAFSDVDAEIYVMADGDGTYDATRAPEMVGLLRTDSLDMVVGVREEQGEDAYRRGHRTGNMLFNRTVAILFGDRFTDIFSGYRVFSRRFVKSFPALSAGFEIETELSVHAIQLRMPILEIPTAYSGRIEGTTSKLRTYRDGFKILRNIALFTQHYRPLLFYGVIAMMLAGLSVGLVYPVIVEFFETGLVPRFPTAILATGIMLTAALCMAIGLILHTMSRGQLEMKRLEYLRYPCASEIPDQQAVRPSAAE